MTMLDPSLIDRYAAHGFVVASGLFDRAQVEDLRGRIGKIAAGQVSDFPEANLEYEPFADRSAATVRKVNRCVEFDPVLKELACGNSVLDIVESLIGPDIKLFGSQCFMKPPGGVAKPYHQDSAYFSIDPPALVTCWIALDDVTIENGCVWCIPGSHQGPLHDHSQAWDLGDRVDKQVPDNQIAIERETPITMTAGSCSFHHSMLLHRSGPNQTGQPRRGLAVHFMSAQSRWTNPAQPAPSYPLLRGREYENCV